MRHHRPLRPCGIRAPRRVAFRVRACRRPRRRACCRVLHLTGELDVAATATLLVAVGHALDRPPGPAGPGLVLDLGGLTFCDAAGLTALLRVRRLAETAGSPVYLTAPPHPVSRLLAVCDLRRSFALHPAAPGPRRLCSAR
ncbi:STAS domain-containing protein [Streptacidiphilus rugosus]|uniref:STAS domain-containing protein n=1 Tax=Streptacidiphilus rugosus TaxID=405783 RepID=UPI00068BAC7F|nr:STAS domain-containing protein [Streptacidiphilus rugosus]